MPLPTPALATLLTAAALAVAGLVTVVWEPRAALGVAVVTVGAAAAYLLARSGATRAERAQVALRARLADRWSRPPPSPRS